jgi:HD-GYP domain-containing protein (c-di-GMP phosphodiesterase class II)
MSRDVRFDATVRASADAAALVAGEMVVTPLGADETAESVILVGATSTVRAEPHTRLIGIVDPGAPGPWPLDWYAIVPGGHRAVLVRAIENAFADLETRGEVARLERELADLNVIGIRLSRERDPERLLDTILKTAREITASDAGSLYLVEHKPDGSRQLRFQLTQNDSRTVPFHASTLTLDHDSIAGHVALTGEPLNLADAYRLPPGATYHVNRSFDELTGYRTKSMLVVPMKTPQGEVIGVLQLINAKASPRRTLSTLDAIDREVVPYGARYVYVASSLASQAAVALQNSGHYADIRQLFDGFVRASVTAIESRDPTTAGHSFRVADLTVALAEAVNGVERGRLADARLDGDALRELRYAALLHDFGKVAVREQVLGKAKKLHPAAFQRIRYRAEVLRREVELRFAHDKLGYVLEKGPQGFLEYAARLDAELAATLAELDDCVARIDTLNQPTVQALAPQAEIDAIARQTFGDRTGRPQPVLTAAEAETLAILRGSLTAPEYREVRAHVVHTFQFLVQIPWTHELRHVPAIARDHHEKLDGSGYPRGIVGDTIPLQSRMMTIADIYDALTAFDRPYKPAIAADRALDILDHERRAGRLDSDLLDLFIDAKVYDVTRDHARGRPDAPIPGTLEDLEF